MTRFAQMANEFPTFDQSTLPTIPAHWQDSSWHNDVCPSFLAAGNFDGSNARVFIDYVKPEDREYPEYERYAVTFDDGSGMSCGDVVSDNWREILEAVAAWERDDLSARYEKAIGYCPFTDCPTITRAVVRRTLAEYAQEAARHG